MIVLINLFVHSALRETAPLRLNSASLWNDSRKNHGDRAYEIFADRDRW